MNPNQTFLRRVLKLDVALEVAAGITLLADGSALADALHVPQSFLTMNGILGLGFAAFIYYIATRSNIPRRHVWSIIGLNTLSAISSFIMLAGGWLETNELGSAVMIAGAVMQLLLADAEFIALRRTRATVAAAA